MPMENKNGEIRRLDGKIRLLRRRGEYLFPVEIWLLNDLKNRNEWRYTEIEKNLLKFVGVPILTAYRNGGKTHEDIGDGHNFQYEEDENGNPAPSFTGATDERIVGAMSDEAKDFRTERRDGAVWAVGLGNIFAWYAKELVAKLEEYAEQGREIPISIETLVSKSRVEDGVEIEEEYEILGVTILGDHVLPAVAGARIAALNSMEERFRELKMRAASYAEHKNSKEGVRQLSVYTKKEREALEARFKGWRVLAAVEDENGIHAALCNEKYELARCDLTGPDDPVTDSKIKPCAAVMDFGIGENVDISDVLTTAAAKEAKLNETITAKDGTIAERDSQIKAMQDAENVRRVNAAKECAKQTLAAFNANRKEKIAENEIKEVCDKIESGCYTAMTDEKGQWCGDKSVENDVYAVCAKAVMESDKAAAAKEKTTYAYNRFAGEKHVSGGVRGLLDKLNIE